MQLAAFLQQASRGSVQKGKDRKMESIIALWSEIGPTIVAPFLAMYGITYMISQKYSKTYRGLNDYKVRHHKFTLTRLTAKTVKLTYI